MSTDMMEYKGNDEEKDARSMKRRRRRSMKRRRMTLIFVYYNY